MKRTEPIPLTESSDLRRYSKLIQLTAPLDADEETQRKYRELQVLEMALCARDKVYWFNTWVWTYNPKLVGARDEQGNKIDPNLPMDLFSKQEEAILWFDSMSSQKLDGLFEKSRDIGFTWMAGGYALHRWLFEDGYKATFGSRKAEYVDRIGDPDCIFEKIRMIYRNLPGWMLPDGFDPRKHDKSMLIENPVRGCYIRGESGDDMGRGGRSTDYFLDEFAFVEHADKVDAATSANSECRIFGSSVNGQGNLFARKRHGGQLTPEQIFRFHWTDDPRKNNKEWQTATKKKVEAHIWASEYDIDYSASVEGICVEAKWVEAAKVIADHVALPISLVGVAGGDVGAGKAKSVVIPRFGVHVRKPKSWTDPDTTDTAKRMVMYCKETVVKHDGFEAFCKTLRFDVTGVGEGVGSTLRRSNEGVNSIAVRVGEPPGETQWPDGKKSNEKFANIKAESWWIMRERFKRTYEHLHFILGTLDEEGQPIGIEHKLEDLVSIPKDNAGKDAMAMSSQLSLVKWFSTETGKIIIESKKQLATRGIASPDYADALALTFTPMTAAEKLKKAFAA